MSRNEKLKCPECKAELVNYYDNRFFCPNCKNEFEFSSIPSFVPKLIKPKPAPIKFNGYLEKEAKMLFDDENDK